MKTPITFLIFNRPKATQRVFEAIQQAKPSKLLVIADGPRPHRPDDAENCAASRAVIDRVDWDCELSIKYSDVNLGCQKCVSSGLNWVFNQVEESIILEDDNLPHPTFFDFCDQMLDYYRDDSRVMVINGQNIQFGRKRNEYSYYFSRYFLSWGWATWKRAWKYYDVEMKLWPLIMEGKCGSLQDILVSPREVKYWRGIFEAVYRKKLDSYSIPWFFACWVQNGLSITPNVNLISNIGFGEDATHTRCNSNDNLYADMPLEPMIFPLRHPPTLICNGEGDKFSQRTHYQPTFFARVASKINRIMGIKSI